MKYLFSLPVMVPVIIIFSFCNGIYFHSVSNELLYIGTAIIGFGSAVISVFYGVFIQGSGTMFTKGAKWFGLGVYIIFFVGSVSGLITTYTTDISGLHPQTIDNLRYLYTNFIVAFSYGAIGIVWSFLTTKFTGSFPKLPKPKESTFVQVEN